MAEVGRPRAERRTRPIRAYEDTAEKLSWVLELEGRDETVADFVESQLRDEVDRRYAPLAHRVQTIKAALAGDPVPTHEIGGEG